MTKPIAVSDAQIDALPEYSRERVRKARDAQIAARKKRAAAVRHAKTQTAQDTQARRAERSRWCGIWERLTELPVGDVLFVADAPGTPADRVKAHRAYAMERARLYLRTLPGDTRPNRAGSCRDATGGFNILRTA